MACSCSAMLRCLGMLFLVLRSDHPEKGSGVGFAYPWSLLWCVVAPKVIAAGCCPKKGSSSACQAFFGMARVHLATPEEVAGSTLPTTRKMLQYTESASWVFLGVVCWLHQKWLWWRHITAIASGVGQDSGRPTGLAWGGMPIDSATVSLFSKCTQSTWCVQRGKPYGSKGHEIQDIQWMTFQGKAQMYTS